jgi:Immunity protein 51
VEPLTIVETEPGMYSLLLNAGETMADETIESAGHEPNGYFWQGVARFLLEPDPGNLLGKLDFDSEGGMFCAYGKDRSALEELGKRMAEVANSPERVEDLLRKADEQGFVFDD